MFTREPEDRPIGRLCAAAAATALVLTPGVAAAGGFDLPDNGTEALGRGGAFVAKASDGTAIHYNPAGLARQRGTHLLASGNLYFHSFEFQRLGTYPDDPTNAETPWGDTVYPAVKNSPQMQLAPFAVVTTDFGYFDRFTLAAGIYAPSTLANRTFPITVAGNQTPSPSRYDFVQGRSTTWLPTLGTGIRVTKWLDLGISGHLVLAHIDQTTVGYSDVGTCAQNTIDDEPRREDWHCDTESRLDVSGTSFAATIGAMLRPSRSIALGLSFRTPTNISANGTLTPTPPKALPDGQSFKAAAANYAYQLPWVARLGGRYIGMDGSFELYDLELDVTYEGWGAAQGAGPILTATGIGTFKDVQTVVMRGYRNTLGLRAGGAYNLEVGDGILALRGGAYFDSSATDFATTRLDYDTLSKIAGTLGLGYKIGPATFDVAYAAVASIPRTVGSGAGAIRPINLADAGSSSGADGTPLSPVNDGTYRGFTHIISLGASLSIEALFGPPRKVDYGRAYEPNYGGPIEPGDLPPPKPVTETSSPPVEKPVEKAPAPKPVEVPPPPAPKPVEAPAPAAPAPKPVEAAAPAPKPVEVPAPAPAAPAPKPVEAPAPAPPPPPVAPPPAPPPPPVVAPAPAPAPPKKERKPASKRREWWEAPN